jgi:hypothetical protein
MARCRVLIKDNIISVTLTSKVTIEDARNIAVDAIPLMEAHKEVLHGGFIDLTDAADADAMARKELSSSLKKCSGYLRKVAVYAPDLKRRVVAKIVLTMGGWRDYKMFSDRDKALKWLTE